MTAIDRLRELGLKLPKTEHALASAEARRVLVVAITTEAINELLAALVDQAEGLSQATADFIASHRYGLELEKQLAAEKARAGRLDTEVYMALARADKAEKQRDSYRADNAELLAMADAAGFYQENMNIALLRAKEAEAENAELKDQRTAAYMMADGLDKMRLKLVAECERLTWTLEFTEGLHLAMRISSIEMQNADLKRQLDELDAAHQPEETP